MLINLNTHICLDFFWNNHRRGEFPHLNPLLEKSFVGTKKNRGINTKIVAIDVCCHNFKIVASRGNK